MILECKLLGEPIDSQWREGFVMEGHLLLTGQKRVSRAEGKCCKELEMLEVLEGREGGNTQHLVAEMQMRTLICEMPKQQRTEGGKPHTHKK